MLGRTDSGRRLLTILVIFVLATGALVTRLGYWQLAQHDQLVESARRQIYKQYTLPSRRGQIYDRSGTVVLAATVMRDQLSVDASRMTDADKAQLTTFLTAQLGLDDADAASIRSKLDSARPYVILAKGLLPEQTQAIEAAAQSQGIGGLTFDSSSSRNYPQVGGSPGTSLAAQLIGFVNADGQGQYGVEQYYQDLLAGQPRVMEADRDASGQPMPDTERTVDPGVPGQDIRLTIDASLQLAIEQEVMTARITDGAASVSAVVMDPWTGEVYAEASYPSYDENTYATTGADNPSIFMDPVVSSVYEPGSVFKMFTVLAGLEQGTTNLTKVYRDTGHLSLAGNTRIGDADGIAMGNLQLQDGIAYSRNVVAARVAIGLAPTTSQASDILHGVWTRMGFGSLTGIDESGETRGLVNDPAIVPWTQIDLANGSFGQGVGVTQIQLATAYAALVNGGKLVHPHVVAGIGDADATVPAATQVIDPSLSPELAGLMNHVLASPWYVDQSQVPGYWIGGKTGTAQVWDNARKQWAFNLYNFSCVGYIGRTTGHPDLVVAVRINEARPGRNAQGQLILPVTSTMLFRRVATDAVTTPGLLPVLDPATIAAANPTAAPDR